MIKEQSAKELAQNLAQKHDLVLLDVREIWEYQLCHIKNSISLPLGDLSSAITDLDKNKTHVVICHHGIRSIQAAQMLMHQGFDVINLTGGIDAWARDVEQSMARY